MLTVHPILQLNPPFCHYSFSAKMVINASTMSTQQYKVSRAKTWQCADCCQHITYLSPSKQLIGCFPLLKQRKKRHPHACTHIHMPLKINKQINKMPFLCLISYFESRASVKSNKHVTKKAFKVSYCPTKKTIMHLLKVTSLPTDPVIILDILLVPFLLSKARAKVFSN